MRRIWVIFRKSNQGGFVSLYLVGICVIFIVDFPGKNLEVRKAVIGSVCL